MDRHQLDEVDRRLLYEYSGNARMTCTELAARVGISAGQCLRRIRVMEDAKVIQGYVAVVDRTFLNVPLEVFVEVRLTGAEDEELKRFERAADKMSDVVSCWRTAGDVDYLVEGFVADLAGYERLLDALAAMSSVAIVRTHLVLRQVKESPRLPSSCLQTDTRNGYRVVAHRWRRSLLGGRGSRVATNGASPLEAPHRSSRKAPASRRHRSPHSSRRCRELPDVKRAARTPRGLVACAVPAACTSTRGRRNHPDVLRRH